MNEPLFKAALSSNPRLFTDDPEVNHAVDCHEEDYCPLYDKELYEREIEAWKNSGGLILSYRTAKKEEIVDAGERTQQGNRG